MRTFHRSLSLRAVAVLLGAALVVTGCSDDEPAEKDVPVLSAEAVATLVETGAKQLASGEIDAARATFTSVVEVDPGNVLAHYNLGLIEQQDGDTEAAIEQYDAALATDPAYGPALYNKAILLEQTDLEEAVALYERAVEAQPEFAPTHMRLGFALVHLGRTEEGEKHLAKGLELDPSMKDVAAPDYD
ncbi:tetratricopeptide repeat protein [Nocardioides alcanivorans]|uniref:tetratricopeptide repeat protein n=1 Tax=Nocardioides alcanivorans TaxID=2897352 RepID=UPI001F1993AE|nr:tetratricopeptide repeat protein [Nocardioides alcanivorans]